MRVDGPAGARAEPVRLLVAQVGEVDDVADHGRAAGDPAVAAARPADGAAARVEGVEAAAVGAGVDERAPARHLRDGGRGVDVAAGALAPGDLPGAGGERVHAPVRGADVHAAVGDGGRGVEVAGAEAERAAARRRAPDLAAVALADRVDAAAVGAEVQLAVGEREAALDRAVGAEAPAHAAGRRHPSRRRCRSPIRSTAGRRRAAGRTRSGSRAPSPSRSCPSCRRARRRGRRASSGPSFLRWSRTT